MSILDNNFDFDSTVLSNMILKYIKCNTNFNPCIKWNIVIDDKKYMDDPKSYYLYYSIDSINSSFNIYIYSSMDIRNIKDIRFNNIYSVVNNNYKPINLNDIIDYEFIRR